MTRASLVLALFVGPQRRDKTRLALALAAIALGVALGYAVQLVNQSAIEEFAQAVRTLSGSADLEIRGPRGGFDEALYARVARLPEVAAASPLIEADVRVVGTSETLRVIGIDLLRVTRFESSLAAVPQGDALDPLRSDTLYLSPAAARALRVQVGDVLALQVGLDEVKFRVAGLGRDEGARYAVADIAGAQSALRRLGTLTRLDLRLRPAVDVASFRARLQAELPPGLFVERPEVSVQRAATVSRAYRVNLNVLALVALFTGGLLVFTTQALAVVRRRAQLALLRVLGMTRRALVALVLGEALLLGAIGATCGLALGFALAKVVLDVVGADLGAGHFRGLQPVLRFDAAWALAFFALGVIAAVAGGVAPAAEAARAAPANALKAGDEQRVFARLAPVWPGVATLAAGAALTLAPPWSGLPILGYVAIALLLVGSIMLMPRFAVAIFGALGVQRPAPVRLALEQLRGAPGHAMLSLATIVASVSLLVSMAIMVASFRSSLDRWLEQMLPAQLYVRSGIGDTAFLAPREQAALAGVPGVERIEFARSDSVLLAAQQPPITVMARAVDARDPGRRLALVSSFIVPRDGAPPPVWVSEAMVDLYGHALGSVIELPIAGSRQRFTVAGVWRDYVRVQGAAVIERDTYVRITGDGNASDAALWLQPDADPDAVTRAIRAALPGGEKLEIAATGELRQRSMRTFDRTFAVTYVLELVALVIGLAGLSSSFGALVLARRREFGMLRHLGMTRRQIGGMLAGQGFAVSALGLAVGVVLGWLISLVLIHVVNRQSFHWSMDLHMPWAALAIFVAVMLAAATLTAIAAARAAMGDAAVHAVKDDW